MHKPYVIKDSKKASYFPLIYGLLHDDLEAIKVGIKAKARPEKLLLNSSANSSQFVSALEFALNECSTEAYEYLFSLKVMTAQEKASFVIQHIVEKDTPEAKLKDVFKKYVSKTNINTLHKVYSFSQPNKPHTKLTFSEQGKKVFKSSSLNDCVGASFLHLACYHKNTAAVELLLKMGANPNLKETKHSKSPAMIVIDRSFSQSSSSKKNAAAILKLLLKEKVNFDLKFDGRSLWHHAIERLKVPELQQIFQVAQPTNLVLISKVRIRSSQLYTTFLKRSKKGFSAYPLIENVAKFEKLRIILSGVPEDFQNIETFFKNKSLKAAVNKRYGTKSPKLCSLIDKNLFQRNSERAVVSPVILKEADLLKSIFLDRKNPNLSDFLTCLESQSSTIYKMSVQCYDRYFSINQFLSFLNTFTDAQKVELLSYNNPGHIQLQDIVRMYFKFEEEMKQELKRVSFSEIKTFIKLHDFLAEKTTQLEQENFPLNQIKHFPILKDIGKIILPEGFGLKLAEDNHELIEWGSKMGHCVGTAGYSADAKYGKTILIAITKNNDPAYCVEIKRNEVVQIQGKGGSVPPKDVLEELFKGLKALKLVKSADASSWI